MPPPSFSLIFSLSLSLLSSSISSCAHKKAASSSFSSEESIVFSISGESFSFSFFWRARSFPLTLPLFSFSALLSFLSTFRTLEVFVGWGISPSFSSSRKSKFSDPSTLFLFRDLSPPSCSISNSLSSSLFLFRTSTPLSPSAFTLLLFVSFWVSLISFPPANSSSFLPFFSFPLHFSCMFNVSPFFVSTPSLTSPCFLSNLSLSLASSLSLLSFPSLPSYSTHPSFRFPTVSPSPFLCTPSSFPLSSSSFPSRSFASPTPTTLSPTPVETRVASPTSSPATPTPPVFGTCLLPSFVTTGVISLEIGCGCSIPAADVADIVDSHLLRSNSAWRLNLGSIIFCFGGCGIIATVPSPALAVDCTGGS
eukprot:comp19518_c0_seq1/m.22817 comp19518_c0_seq1/g.22817  ORF comp19518_c0_seq1/g.22817 comp19518_c0_seq1/m.22817 type:complete len:365 (+) comp19518_c0_seq1:854-1948(+)